MRTGRDFGAENYTLFNAALLGRQTSQGVSFGKKSVLPSYAQLPIYYQDYLWAPNCNRTWQRPLQTLEVEVGGGDGVRRVVVVWW
jgi:hypothetical protein